MKAELPQNVFEQSLKWEKGFTNDPDDLGGITNDGITYDHYCAFCKEILGRVPSFKHFKNLNLDEKKAFYSRIWKRMWCHKIEDDSVAAVCFDFGLNSKYAKREIQEVLIDLGYKLEADNIFGPITIKALNAATKKLGGESMVKNILDKRQQYVESLDDKNPPLAKFMKGWTNRINDWREFVLSLPKISPESEPQKTESVQNPIVES